MNDGLKRSLRGDERPSYRSSHRTGTDLSFPFLVSNVLAIVLQRKTLLPRICSHGAQVRPTDRISVVQLLHLPNHSHQFDAIADNSDLKH